MNEENYAVANNPAPVNQSPETVTDWAAWNKHFDEQWAYLDEVEPLPDNFEAICEGRETVPVYSGASAA